MSSGTKITTVEEVPADTTTLVTVRDIDSGEEQEAVLTELGDGVAGWLNYCQHFTHIALDKGSGAPMRDGEIICANHGAYFESDSGQCTYGPCEGAFLEGIDVTAEDGDVYLTDEEYEFVATGGIETDDLDRTSTSNVEF
jgi:nitrite reductase/ring-hydroxylating ferredoxin subunit